jgi:ribosome maturation factor RimP
MECVTRLLGRYPYRRKWVEAHFFLLNSLMTHPLIPQIIDLATPVATELGLEIVNVVFHTNQSPPILRVDIFNPLQDIGLDDCERIIPDAYILEVSSPGISRQLVTDREFISFKGFPVIISTSPPYEQKQEWIGLLIRRDETTVYLNQKGRVVEIPRDLITRVQIDERR